MNCVQEQLKKRPHTNTIQILWIVKKTAHQYKPNPLDCEKGEQLKNSLREADGGF